MNTAQITAEQEREALAWLSQLHGQPDPSAQVRFSRWLAADPAHAEAYAQAQVLWELCEGPALRLADEESASLQRLLHSMEHPPRRARSRWVAGLAMAACLLLMVGVGAGWHPFERAQDLGADYVSRNGQVLTVILADRSEVTLDANSAIAVDFSHGQRRVQLRRGAAFFHVRHTGAPFVVEANGGRSQVLGTRFEVRSQADGAQVTVLEGRVGVTAERDRGQQVLGAGQQLAYRDGIAQAPASVDAQAQLAWRDGQLNYYRAPLGTVVRDLARYYPGRIVLFSDELAARTVSGSFSSHDPQAALDSLQTVLGFQQYRLVGGLIVLR